MARAVAAAQIVESEHQAEAELLRGGGLDVPVLLGSEFVARLMQRPFPLRPGKVKRGVPRGAKLGGRRAHARRHRGPDGFRVLRHLLDLAEGDLRPAPALRAQRLVHQVVPDHGATGHELAEVEALERGDPALPQRHVERAVGIGVVPPISRHADDHAVARLQRGIQHAHRRRGGERLKRAGVHATGEETGGEVEIAERNAWCAETGGGHLRCRRGGARESGRRLRGRVLGDGSGGVAGVACHRGDDDAGCCERSQSHAPAGRAAGVGHTWVILSTNSGSRTPGHTTGLPRTRSTRKVVWTRTKG